MTWRWLRVALLRSASQCPVDDRDLVLRVATRMRRPLVWVLIGTDLVAAAARVVRCRDAVKLVVDPGLVVMAEVGGVIEVEEVVVAVAVEVTGTIKEPAVVPRRRRKSLMLRWRITLIRPLAMAVLAPGRPKLTRVTTST